MMIDAAAQADRLALDREKLKADQEREGLKLGLKAQSDQRKMEAEQEREGLRIGVDIAKTKAQMARDDKKGDSE
jgi:hypothetical protein